MIDFAHMTLDQRELRRAMSQISEDCWCAGWIDGLELALWGALQTGQRDFGMDKIDYDDFERLKRCAAAVNGWIIFRSDQDEPGLPADEWGNYFVPMAEWLVMFPKMVKERERRSAELLERCKAAQARKT